MDIYLVGGAVRDQLLGYPYSEKDWVVVGASPQAMSELGFTPVGKDFPVFLHPETKEEYALARTERKTGRGYAGFHFDCASDISLEDDLRRRDLTINAIAQTDTGQLVDPYGGAHDIENRVLRHVSEAFSEDPVRILRVARFAARYHHMGFTVAAQTMQLMTEMVETGEADHLVAERVWKEMSRALTEKNPEVFIQTLKDCGALAKTMPEIEALFGVPQPAKHHPEIDTGLHTLMVLHQACRLSDSPTVRFAALMHDLGKALTPEQDWPRHHGHEKTGLKPIQSLCQRLAVPNDYRDLALLTCEFHTHAHRAQELKPATIFKLFKRLDAQRRPERFEQFLLACEADAKGRTGFEQCEYPQATFLQGALDACNSVNPKDLLAAGFSGAQLGQQLERQRIAAIAEYKHNVSTTNELSRKS
ncbi:multifunctional CCA addition/repair protein [Gilvimarinus sp. SDUM040013]|uniref:Multifunctional CCA protein n=1 Tax=Gilvimarinus gilvus TaxID=3058038 RepID=A0ABU4RWL5_9GAMM|nr:multifunctional CCA addition/repair protein [Gilvimarinus sp. SDUM040013]MDO3385297.1 multifunctional CCA addition/repair protein [Gilvimarinus sp. SDUM040013]MDX6849280.1 multifunctional CCA addition/repair protein [Gilvimarinus sp. SDUM040013]